MVQMTPGDLPGLPVEHLARFLLECARADPALLARSDARPSTGRDAGIRLPPAQAVEAAAPPLRLPASRTDPELEELVSIAVACARRAEDAL